MKETIDSEKKTILLFYIVPFFSHVVPGCKVIPQSQVHDDVMIFDVARKLSSRLHTLPAAERNSSPSACGKQQHDQ